MIISPVVFLKEECKKYGLKFAYGYIFKIGKSVHFMRNSALKVDKPKLLLGLKCIRYKYRLDIFLVIIIETN